jgi:hypothetical protein
MDAKENIHIEIRKKVLTAIVNNTNNIKKTRTITFHLKLLHIKKTTKYDVGNPHKYDGVKCTDTIEIPLKESSMNVSSMVL